MRRGLLIAWVMMGTRSLAVADEGAASKRARTREPPLVEEPSCVASEVEADDAAAAPPPRVPAGYDYDKGTHENYRSARPLFAGPFADIRRGLDYAYHNHYTAERQRVQDAIVERFMATRVVDAHDARACEAPTQPWIVFTAGAMGAGKSFVLKWLVQGGRFPMAAFVHVDPDAVKYLLPEMQGYIRRDQARAGSLTHHESGFIAEIITQAALLRGKNVLVDGSLRNVAWYRQHMRALKAEHAQLRIAIVHVDAPADVVLRRAAKRARNTGREVPRALLLETLEAVPASVAALSPEADFVCRIHNGDAGVPTLTTPGLAWADFTAQWEQECRRDSYLAPICVDAEATPRPKYFV